jgi:hypothetical protein
VQQPRIPIWVVGAWLSKRSIQRVLRYDGLLPQVLESVEGTSHNAQQAHFAALREMKAYIENNRMETTPFDIVIEGVTPGDRPEEAAAMIREWANAGATWWLESMWQADSAAAVRARILQGPPRMEFPTLSD